MIEELTYSYAAMISERIQAWTPIATQTERKESFRQWQERKSLLKETDYQKIFRYYQYSEQTFSSGLLPFTEERAQLLVPVIENSEWFQLHRKLFSSEVAIKDQGLSAALRFHLHDYRKKIQQAVQRFPAVYLSDTVITALVEQLSEEFFFIAQKTLVWDVHQMIEEYHLQGETKEEEFSRYIKEFLGDKQRTYLFYAEYPTLARLLAVRLRFACEMIEEFLFALNESAKQLTETFALAMPMELTDIRLGQGDSHDNGKTVIQFQVQQKDLIFKFKQLEIGERFNSLLAYLEELNPTSAFYKIQRIVQPTYTIEEKVSYQECGKQSEITTFYQNYGELLAIVYWLGSTDLHMENLIAHGSYPVLIDVETIIRPELFKSKNLSRQTRIEKHSAIVSGLLPQKRNLARDLEQDALSGKKQKLPKKVRRLKNIQSSDISFQLEEAYMDGAQNIPRFEGKEVDYRLYTSAIEQGFKQMNHVLLNHKQAFIEKVQELFSDTMIRLIYRDTQDYGNLLNFTLHTECMSNYVEREKIIENLWGSKIVPEKLIPFEIQELLQHDIPLFTANTSSKNVYINGQEIPELLQKTPLQETLCHMKQIDEVTSNFSYLLLKESLGTLTYAPQEIAIPMNNYAIEQPLLQRAADIGDKLIRELVVNKKSRTVDWLSVTPVEGEHAMISYPNTDLYGGSAGIYLFLVYLNYYIPKPEYQHVIELLETELFAEQLTKNTYESAFFDEGMRLTTAFYVTNLLKDQKHYQYIITSLANLKNGQIPSENQQNEWIYGKASLLSILAKVYQAFPEKTVVKLLLSYAQAVECQEMENSHFAHGYGGVLYGLIQANQVLKEKSITKKIHWYQEKFIAAAKQEIDYNESWCKGTTGIKAVYHLLDLPLPMKYSQEVTHRPIEDDCLCHGNYGNSDNNLNNILLLSQKKIQLKSDPNSVPLSLFLGLSGVGYQLLRAYAPMDIPSLLFVK